MESSATASELSLDCKPHTYSMLLKSFGEQHLQNNNHHLHDHDQTQKLKDILSCLEDERLKIDAFKRELPLCMQLLTNAVETLRQQLQAYKSSSSAEAAASENQHRPVLEEFIPIKQQFDEENPDQKKASSNNVSDKANWMTSAQLWCQTNNIEVSKNGHHESDNNNTISFNIVSPKLGLDAKHRNGGGAFLPFSKERASRSVTDLALVGGGGCSDEKDMMLMDHDKNSCFEGDIVNEVGKTQMVHNSNTTTDQPQVQNSNGGGHTNRKARRCWSPDLHRRFVNALQMLGGSQVATPKQIRELMKVDGLTNDEVKSHLQKYRLHTRRPTCPSTQQTTGGTAPPHHQLVVLGGIWVPPEYYSSAVGAPHQVSHAPSHFCPPPNFYHNNTNITTTNNNNDSVSNRLINHNGKIFHAYGSTEGDGDRSESMEDGKSESCSGENGGDRKLGLVAFKEDGDQESNESEITLKF